MPKTNIHVVTTTKYILDICLDYAINFEHSSNNLRCTRLKRFWGYAAVLLLQSQNPQYYYHSWLRYSGLQHCLIFHHFGQFHKLASICIATHIMQNPTLKKKLNKSQTGCRTRRKKSIAAFEVCLTCQYIFACAVLTKITCSPILAFSLATFLHWRSPLQIRLEVTLENNEKKHIPKWISEYELIGTSFVCTPCVLIISALLETNLRHYSEEEKCAYMPNQSV